MEFGGVQHILHSSALDKFRIWNLADLHLFNAGTAYDRLERDIKEIGDDPYSFWFGGGDNAEYISPNDPRFDPLTLSNLTLKDLANLGKRQTEVVRNTLKPIAHKCLGLLMGNHEWKYYIIKEQEYLHGWLCTELETPNLGYCAFADVVFVKMKMSGGPKLVRNHRKAISSTSARFRFFLHHGAGYAQTEGGKLNKLVQFMNRFDADVYLCGHVHDQMSKSIVQLTANDLCTDCKDRIRVGVISGSYLRTYAKGVCGYGERHGYMPTYLGAGSVVIDPQLGTIKAMV